MDPRRVLAIVATCALTLTACAAPTPAQPAAPQKTPAAAATGTVGVVLNEWKIELTAPVARTGPVVFNARNEGKVPHDLVIVRSDLAPNALPTTSGLVDEGKVRMVGRTEQLTPGDGKWLTVELAAGKYVLVCNVIGHYNSGQFAAFTVQ